MKQILKRQQNKDKKKFQWKTLTTGFMWKHENVQETGGLPEV